MEDNVFVEWYVEINEGFSQISDQVVAHGEHHHRESKTDNFSSSTGEWHTK